MVTLSKKYLIGGGLGILVVFLISMSIFVFFKHSLLRPLPPSSVEKAASTHPPSERNPVGFGSYAISPSESVISWSDAKPRSSDGYAISGTLSIETATVTVIEGTTTGIFALALTTLHVGTVTKEAGNDRDFEEILKGPGFLDSKKFPLGKFTVTEMVPYADSATTFMYSVKGDLTLKNVTHQILFPAVMYVKEGRLHIEARTEIDRSLWNLTFGPEALKKITESVMSNTIAISLALVADPK